MISRKLRIYRESDAIFCSHECSDFAEHMGFEGEEVWEIAIAVSELVTNVIKFAGKGEISISRITEPREGVRIVVEDEGPGIVNIEEAMKDGFSEGAMRTPKNFTTGQRGLGAGLGAVRRLMDDVLIENREPHGVRVTATKYLEG